MEYGVWSMEYAEGFKDAFDGSIEGSLYYAYHGEPDKDIASHAMMFCAVSGKIFSKLIDKEFASLDSLSSTQRDTPDVRTTKEKLE
jgi:hypothetical protein